MIRVCSLSNYGHIWQVWKTRSDYVKTQDIMLKWNELQSAYAAWIRSVLTICHIFSLLYSTPVNDLRSYINILKICFRMFIIAYYNTRGCLLIPNFKFNSNTNISWVTELFIKRLQHTIFHNVLHFNCM